MDFGPNAVCELFPIVVVVRVLLGKINPSNGCLQWLKLYGQVFETCINLRKSHFVVALANACLATSSGEDNWQGQRAGSVALRQH